MKKLHPLLVLALLAVAVIGCTTVQAAPPLQDAPAAPDTPRKITVVGQGKVSLVPDVARINVGAEERAASVSEAKASVDRQIAAITSALSELGVEAKDIQTNHYSIHYEREPPMPMHVMSENMEGPDREGYRVSNMLRVTVRDVEQAGKVLDAVVEAGANQVYGVNFTVSDEAEWQGQARAEAVADAKTRAQELADLAGIELGEVLSVSEVIGGMWTGPTRIMYESGMGGGGGLAPGELEMGTQVQVTFAVQ
jgi:uncharacterized protein YggE